MASSPSKGYAPGKITCPGNSSFIREANSISSDEADWVASRHKKTDLAVIDFLENAGLEDFDAASFVTSANQSVNLAVAFSGGSYRAMLMGAGSLAALDNRTSSVSSDVGLGGILQSSTYLAGLSGGAWLVGLLVMQGFPSVEEVVFEDPYDAWNLTTSRQLVNQTGYLKLEVDVARVDYTAALSHANYWNTPSGDGIKDDLAEKTAAGFDTSLTDVWARGLAHQLFTQGKNNWLSSATWSDIRDISAFSNHEMPFPLVTALARKPDSLVFDLNSPIVEFNAFEIGSFDTSVNTFHDIKYLGTKVDNGISNGTCIAGFDNAGFVIGTSSSLFNEFLDTLVCDDCNSLSFVVKYVVKKFLKMLSKKQEDIAMYNPNPFYGSSYSKSDNLTSSETLYLMDGGIGGEVIPLSTLMTKERELDLVFAFDNGPGWPDGSALVNTYNRQFTYEGKSTVCPYIPGQSTFGKLNLTAKPTFFGCSASNLTALEKDGVVPPIVVYIANRPFEFYSNTSTFELSYTDAQKKSMVQNGFDVASRMNNTFVDDWQTCVACAVIRREQERLGIEQSDQCKKCFDDYCWDGTTYEDPDYYFPVNFTLTGLTNNSMSLWTAADFADGSNGTVYSNTTGSATVSGSSTSTSTSTSASTSTGVSTTTKKSLLLRIWLWFRSLF